MTFIQADPENAARARAEREKAIRATKEWIDGWTYSRMVTLQFNDWRNRRLPEVGRLEHIRRALRQWDAFMNRKLLGKYWQASPDRMFSFFVPEKVDYSPHWHGLIRFPTHDPVWRARLELGLERQAVRQWLRVAPYGSCFVQPIHNQYGATNYLAKTLNYTVSYEHFVIPDEFMRG